jgi:ribosomal protein S18 acetylase RimI-like enzyme
MEIATWINQVQIRPVQKADLPGLEWEGEFAHFRRIYADAYERSRKGRSVLWVAELQPGVPSMESRPDGRIIGQLFVQLICDRPELADGANKGYIFAFRVRPTFRSGGLGTRMISVAEEDLISRNFKIATLNVAQTNLGALRLYERLGYHVVSADPGRWSYPDENGSWHFVEEPAWRMEKKLN